MENVWNDINTEKPPIGALIIGVNNAEKRKVYRLPMIGRWHKRGYFEASIELVQMYAEAEITHWQFAPVAPVDMI